MSGYAAAPKPSEGVDMPLHRQGTRDRRQQGPSCSHVTTDLIGLPREITDPVSARVGQVHNSRRAQILFNSSHTHAGPVSGLI
jgi:hypothetical protein